MAKRYYENRREVSTIAHLHGQILFSEAKEYPFDYSIRDMVKNRDYQTACKNRIGGQLPLLISERREFTASHCIRFEENREDDIRSQ